MPDIQDIRRWNDEMIRKIIGNLGLDINKTHYEMTESDDNLIMSSLYYIHLRFENKTNGQSEGLSMILKRPRLLDFSRIARVDLQFRNEILFYQTCAQSDEVYPKCFYIEEPSPIESIIVLENVNKRGYYSCPYVHNPPLEYTLAVMRELGRFHGKGYAMKELQREKFFSVVTQIQEVRFVKSPENIYEFMSNVKSVRAVEYLRSQGYDTIFCNKMETCLSNAFDEMIKIAQPIEPLATLCHGDFTLSNILFKTEDDGRYCPMLIDFALIRYSTPVIDLSTYLYICCSNEMRKDKFSEIMQAYHDGLIEHLLESGIQNIEKYSYHALLNDFRRGALFGFIIMCTFIPILLGHLSSETVVQEIIDLGSLESAKKQKYAGGDEVSKIMADALLQLKDFGCLKHIL